MPPRKPKADSPESSHPPIDIFLGVLRAIAEREALAVRDNPSELSQAHSRSHQLAGELGLPPRTKAQQSVLPIRGVLVDHYAVLVAPLGDNPALAEVMQRMAYCHRHAAVCLSWLSTNFKSDLNLFLVGPSGSATDGEWCALAARLERDESVCRKMVWLPPKDPKEMEKSANTFFERTFLARPWKFSANQQTPELSPINRLSLGDPVFQSWLAVLDAPGDDPGAGLVDRLIRAWKEHQPKVGNVSQSSENL